MSPAVHRAVLFLAGCSLLTGCVGFGAGTGSTIPFRRLQPGSHAGGLYLYRAPDSASYWTRYFVSFDGRAVGELRVGGYLYVQAAPGKHRVEIRQKAPSTFTKKNIEPMYEVEFRAGHNTIVRFPVVSEGILFRFGAGFEKELFGMKEDGAVFLRAVPE